MFSIKAALIKTTLGWFNKKKNKSHYLELDLGVKNKFERQNLIDWQKDKCVVCRVLLKIIKDMTYQILKCPTVISLSDLNIIF